MRSFRLGRIPLQQLVKLNVHRTRAALLDKIASEPGPGMLKYYRERGYPYQRSQRSYFALEGAFGKTETADLDSHDECGFRLRINLFRLPQANMDA